MVASHTRFLYPVSLSPHKLLWNAELTQRLQTEEEERALLPPNDQEVPPAICLRACFVASVAELSISIINNNARCAELRQRVTPGRPPVYPPMNAPDGYGSCLCASYGM